ncbi:uncharacterized protein LOC132196446 [Neocloeon triangulifer]|uniref:uncharacterized protein LOC132196446 n=1 Tax=Neocloeon triangulifer TaxID=2078957 RepID=UPI00286F9D2F|nr:uncharacterized protein LOC132196446 [Neocloeon triangulifer]
MGRAAALLVIFLLCHLRSEGAEEGAPVKKARAPAQPGGEELGTKSATARPHDDDDGQQSHLPASFLSPSVLQALELGKAIPGRAGSDYPVLGEVPYTNFYCDEQPYPGFFADTETRCQAWHYCDIDGRQASFLCPNGTQFNQAVFVCDWWFNVRCDLSTVLYALNDRLYRRPHHDVAAPHRSITKDLLENIFT